MVEPEMKTAIVTASARIIRTSPRIPMENPMNPLCEFFLLDSDHPDGDGACILRNDGCPRKNAVKHCLDCWRRYCQDLQRRFRDEFKK